MSTARPLASRSHPDLPDSGILSCAAARRAWLAVCAVAMSLAMVPGAHAQTVRDPTLPPPGAVSSPTAGASGGAAVPDTGPVAVIVRDGRPFLVVGTRLYAQGQMLGGLRVERITETEVWLREGKTLHKKPIFSGITRSVAGGTPKPPECVPPAGKTSISRRPTTAPAVGKKADLPPPGVPCKP